MTSISLASPYQRRMLAGFMFRPSPAVSLPAIDQLRIIERVMERGVWTIVEGRKLSRRSADKFAQKYGNWGHRNGTTPDHNTLGMAWAWESIQSGLEINLFDSPDIDGRVGDATIAGDIGQCTFVAWWSGVHQLEAGDVWISVLGRNLEVCVEMQQDVDDVLGLLN